MSFTWVRHFGLEWEASARFIWLHLKKAGKNGPLNTKNNQVKSLNTWFDRKLWKSGNIWAGVYKFLSNVLYIFYHLYTNNEKTRQQLLCKKPYTLERLRWFEKKSKNFEAQSSPKTYFLKKFVVMYLYKV